MNKIIRLIKNIKFLSKFVLKEKIPVWNYEEIVENILYYIPTSNIVRPKVFDKEETLDALLNGEDSIARFGDGELMLIEGQSIPYQEYDEKLAKRMKDILYNSQNHLMVGINYSYFYPKYDSSTNKLSKDFQLFGVPKCRSILNRLINFDIQYYDSGFTGFSDTNTKDFFDKLRSIWNNKKIFIIGCKEANDDLKFNIYDNAKQIDYFFCPNKHAWKEYDKIIKSCKKYDKKTIIILMCGPTGKVLASDLTKEGYRSLDLGHIAKAYDYYCRNIPYTADNVFKFFSIDESIKHEK